MTQINDGPRSPHFSPLIFQGNMPFSRLADAHVSQALKDNIEHAPHGSCTAWGIPFEIYDALLLDSQPVSIEVTPRPARWLVFQHTADTRPLEWNAHGLLSPTQGYDRLGELAARYVVRYVDGSEVSVDIRRRHQIGCAVNRHWGENCFTAVAHHKPYPQRAAHEQPKAGWGWTQTRVSPGDAGSWVNWLFAWENPHPDKTIAGFRFEPVTGVVVLSAITAGDVQAHPLRWQPRQKACLKLPPGETFLPDLNEHGLLSQVQLDLGQVISASPRPAYPNERWQESYNNQIPDENAREILIEFTAHPEACFYLIGGKVISVTQALAAQWKAPTAEAPIQLIPAAQQPVKLRVVERSSHQPVPVKLHVHGEWGEYLAPIDRHRILNPAWFEDYSADFAHLDWRASHLVHPCTYINGETTLKLPQSKVFIEVSKGFEIRPVRQVVTVTPDTQEITITIEKVLPWREKGWVTADTHVHFLSPVTAMLEGSAEGVNIINLLASQWGELMTNVGDFDGKNTWGSREAGSDGEYLVRVGTENRQHVLGHISLLGYRGSIIAPMTTGGPDESALGDPIEILLTEWARQCKRQGGLVVLPHFPNPRAEHAASIVCGEIDAIEMTSWEDHYSGISPYSLSDWYRYLNCGYLLPAVGGTDKMSAATAVGTVRTYARIAPETAFSYDAWMEAVRRAETFVSYGPLLEFYVDGQPMGSRIVMSRSGGTVDVAWQVASVTVPMSRVELVVNGEIRESQAVTPWAGEGSWQVKMAQSSWLALLVRGHYPDKPEIITAHSSPVMVHVEGSPLLAAADAVTILEQIEGALVYLDTVGTRADDRAYKRMRLTLESAYRTLHNRMHQQGRFHDHTALTEHPGKE